MSSLQPRQRKGAPASIGGQWRRDDDRADSGIDLDRGTPGSGWPAIGRERLEWDGDDSPFAPAASRYYEGAVLPTIADADVVLGSSVLAEAERATVELAALDAEIGDRTAPFASLLLRSEAVASSRIEQLTARARAIVEAEIGRTSKENASLIAGNAAAMRAAIDLADRIDADAILTMHRILLEDENPKIAGSWRQEPVWLGGASSSPVTASYVAPRHELVPHLIDDLAAFAARDDIPAFAKVAITHAQFESIHPFPDGNGRTGRALAQAMLRHAGITKSVIVPLSAGILHDTNEYFQALRNYQAGDLEPIVQIFAESVPRAAANTRQLIAEIDEIDASWRRAVHARSDSSIWKILDYARTQPIFTPRMLERDLGISVTNTSKYLGPLEQIGILKSASFYKQKAWRSDDILAALDRFAERAARRTLGTP